MVLKFKDEMVSWIKDSKGKIKEMNRKVKDERYELNNALKPQTLNLFFIYLIQIFEYDEENEILLTI